MNISQDDEDQEEPSRPATTGKQAVTAVKALILALALSLSLSLLVLLVLKSRSKTSAKQSTTSTAKVEEKFEVRT